MPLATGLAVVLALAYLVVDPTSADLAAAVYRADLFGRQGFAVWENGWYGGHHVPGYSVLFPPLAHWFGPQLVGAIAAVVATIGFRRITPNRTAGVLFAIGCASELTGNRLPFMLGIAFATWALARRSPLLAAGTTLASPVAGLFLALVAIAWWLRDRRGAALVIAAVAPAVALAVLFPEGGVQPFSAVTFWPAALAVLVAYALTPRWRAGIALYGAALTAAYLLETPMGSNAARLGALLFPALVAAAGRRLLLVAALPILLYAQWQPVLSDWHRTWGDPSNQAAYFTLLNDWLARQGGPPFRIEIPFTVTHFEAARVAPHTPLARGWERQLDIRHNRLFYERTLTEARLRDWLHENAVRFVALPDVRLDPSARQEARIVARWTPIATPGHWRVYAVPDPVPLGVSELTTDGFVARTGGIVRIRWTGYWSPDGACVRRSRDGWTQVTLSGTRPARVRARLSAAGALAPDHRCG